MTRFSKWFAAAGGVMISAAALAQTAPAPLPGPPDESRVIRITRDSGDAMQHVALGLNQAVVVELDRDARDVVVANPLIADAVVKTPRRIFLMSLKAGQTNALLLDAQGVQIANLQISVGSEVGDLNRQIIQQVPGTHITATALGDNIVLSGTASSVQEAGKAQALAQRFASAPSKLVNNITIDQRQQVLIQVRVSEMSRTISKQLGLNLSTALMTNGVPIIASTANQFTLSGIALSNLANAQIGSVCAGAFNPVTTIASTVASAVANTATNNASTNPLIIEPGVTNGVTTTSNTGRTVTTNTPCTSPNNLQGMIQALEQVGLAHTLAEPNLTAVSGESAKFLAGGEFPVPVSHDLEGNITVEYKPFGVGLAFTPVVLSEGRISLQISTEVSELTNTGAFTESGGTTSTGQPVAGLTLPALAVRRTETTVELPSGGSLAIGGLIQQSTKQNLEGLPGVMNLPVLGALFRSRDFQNNESELVVTVTAYLVNPVSPKMLAGPDDGFAPATDLETTLRGNVNATYGKDKKPAAALDSQSLGYIIE